MFWLIMIFIPREIHVLVFAAALLGDFGDDAGADGRPPSRMAKRKPSSMAIGCISSTSIVTLSPGMIISVPAGNAI